MPVGQPKEQVLLRRGSEQRDRGSGAKRLHHGQHPIGQRALPLCAGGAFPYGRRAVTAAFGTDPAQHIPTVGGKRFRICRGLTLPNPKYGPYVAKSLHLKGIPPPESILIGKCSS